MKKNISWSSKFRVIGTVFYGLVVSDVRSSSLKKTVKWTLLPVLFKTELVSFAGMFFYTHISFYA